MNAPLRRGACPGLSAPMQTGDGLLVRLRPIGAVPLAAFGELCALAQKFGNGIVEVTVRGSIQVRGLSSASAMPFAHRVAKLGIAAADGIPVLTNPLAGIAADEIFDVTHVASDLRGELALRPFTARLSPKLSVVIDGGGALNLDALTADVRLRAAMVDGDKVFAVSIGGDGASAVPIGCVAAAAGARAATQLLEVLAKRGRDARARAIVAAEGIAAFRSALADLVVDDRTRPARPCASEIVGAHRLLNGSCASGVGLAFGHADASSLESLIRIAEQAGASGLIAAPRRTLIAVGLGHDTVSDFTNRTEQLGFITRADDPRRRVVACAGAPFCASGKIAARALAPSIAAAAAPFLDGSQTIHISGCAKGCAHPASAALTVVGTSDGCALIADGSAQDSPFAVAPENELPVAIAKYARGLRCEESHV